ncbi:MAG: pro-sigmaK processing inhibitor BofA family protein [Clostridiales bacterium]|jgi:inhibitor of the pro-sigma K processing machinery|nr:pro-sigmaK processing inhibitor BofA family protein [Clostridiales bacterium]
MDIFSVILSFFIGGLLIVLLSILFSVRTKGLFRLLLNSLAGGLALLLFGLFDVMFLPVNPLNALLVGALGVPGLAVIILVALFA